MKPKSLTLPTDRLPVTRFTRMCCVALIAGMPLLGSPAFAVDFGERIPSVEQLIDALNISSQSAEREGFEMSTIETDSIRTRGIKIVTQHQSSESRSHTGGSRATAEGKVSMIIRFALNSDRVLQASTLSLNNLATALNSDTLKDRRFEVIGHTDITGLPSYNLTLSRRRAESVTDFLSIAGVDRLRASTSGHGAAELLSNLAPDSARHRRVEIRIIKKNE